MSKMIQIRHVPDALHRKLKARAAMQGMSLSEYIKRELKLLAAQPTLEEWFERVSKHEPVELPISAAEMVRAERDSR
jgi:plasmid stability protein